MHVAQELIACLDQLATLPTVYYRVREVLDSPDSSIQNVADAIATDPALTTTLLKLANSAFFGFPRRIETLSRAISLMGLEEVQNVVLATTIANSFTGIRPQHIDMAEFWRDSVFRALLCRQIAHMRKLPDAERLFVVGLLADMGHLVMYHAVPELMSEILEHDIASAAEQVALEQKIIGCDFAEVGAALSNCWRLPVSFGVIIGEQLVPANAGEHARDAAAVFISNSLCGQAEPRVNALPEVLSPALLALAQIEATQIPTMMARVKDDLGSVLKIFSS